MHGDSFIYNNHQNLRVWVQVDRMEQNIEISIHQKRIEISFELENSV